MTLTPPLIPRRRLLGASACLGLVACAQTPVHPPLRTTHPTAQLPATVQRDWHDAASGHTWRVWAQWPDGPAPAAGHPVLYVLDGNATFPIAAQLARNDDARPAAMKHESVVVVGIGHPADAPYSPPLRQRDYTPPSEGQAATAQMGGAGLLRQFIATEVQPWVTRTRPVDPARQTLFGHSLAGLFVLDTLFNRPDLFRHHAAASPSIWWNHGQLLQTAQRFVTRHAAAARPFQAHIQMRVGSLETPQAATTHERAAAQQDRKMIDNMHNLTTLIHGQQWAELTVDMAIYPGADHGGVLPLALIDALALARRS